MGKDESSQSNQLNLTVVALVALVAIVGLVALVMNAASIRTVPSFATGSEMVSAREFDNTVAVPQENIAGGAIRTADEVCGMYNGLDKRGKEAIRGSKWFKDNCMVVIA